MLVLGLDHEDLAATRFAISPMEDVVASLHRRARPGGYALTREWEAAAERRLAGTNTTLLDALVSPRGWTPDFLSPFPERPTSELDEELRRIAGTPPERVRPDFEAAYQGGPLPAVISAALRKPELLLQDIALALRGYWDAMLRDLWQRIRAVLEADIAHWSHQLASGGLAAMFSDLHPTIRWDGRSLYVDVAPDLDLEVAVAGRRLPLVLSVFARWPLVNIAPELPPVLVYPARGAGLVWDTSRHAPPDLARLLGRGRADVLAALDGPRATVDLAQLVGATPSAVSQHLQILAGAGLVTRARRGRRVLYERTAIGNALVAQKTAA